MEGFHFVERRFWEGLQGLDEELLRERLGRYATDRELRSLLRRRDLLVEHFEGLIAERGMAAVVYEF